MNNFGRTLRLVLRYPWTLAGSAFCAIMVAVLWGANIGSMYPIVEIIFAGDKGGQTLQQWIDEGIASEKARIEEIEHNLEQLEKQLAAAQPDEHARLTSEREIELEELATAQSILEKREWFRP